MITSRDNSLLRLARATRDGKSEGLIFVEGLRLCEEAVASQLEIEAAIYSEEIARKDRAVQLITKLESVAKRLDATTEKLLATIAYTQTPQGIVLIAHRPPNDRQSFESRQPANSLIAVLHQVSNPVNVGAIIRTSEAAGGTGIITTNGTSDPFNAKALRGAMGSTFRVPIWAANGVAEVMEWCREREVRTIATASEASKSYLEVDFCGPTAVIVGTESEGLSDEEVAAADEVVRIPMKGPVESLNVAVSASILLYEANRQRGMN